MGEGPEKEIEGGDVIPEAGKDLEKKLDAFLGGDLRELSRAIRQLGTDAFSNYPQRAGALVELAEKWGAGPATVKEQILASAPEFQARVVSARAQIKAIMAELKEEGLAAIEQDLNQAISARDAAFREKIEESGQWRDALRRAQEVMEAAPDLRRAVLALQALVAEDRDHFELHVLPDGYDNPGSYKDRVALYHPGRGNYTLDKSIIDENTLIQKPHYDMLGIPSEGLIVCVPQYSVKEGQISKAWIDLVPITKNQHGYYHQFEASYLRQRRPPKLIKREAVGGVPKAAAGQQRPPAKEQSPAGEQQPKPTKKSLGEVVSGFFKRGK